MSVSSGILPSEQKGHKPFYSFSVWGSIFPCSVLTELYDISQYNEISQIEWYIPRFVIFCTMKYTQLYSNRWTVIINAGLGPRLHEPRNLTSNKSRRCSQIVSSSLAPNVGHIDSQGSGRENPIGKYSVSPTFERADANIPEKEISIAKKLGAIYMFMRPYQIYGTVSSMQSS